MTIRNRIVWLVCITFLLGGCGGCYSLRGVQTSGASTVSVGYFGPVTALASPVYAQRFTESLRDLLQTQSPLKLVDEEGELRYEGSITGYQVAPTASQAGETAALNRLSITVKVRYTNTREPDLSFDRSFTRFADFEAAQDLFSVEENLWQQINEQLVQEIFNASLGNW